MDDLYREGLNACPNLKPTRLDFFTWSTIKVTVKCKTIISQIYFEAFVGGTSSPHVGQGQNTRKIIFPRLSFISTVVNQNFKDTALNIVFDALIKNFRKIIQELSVQRKKLASSDGLLEIKVLLQ